MPDFQPAGRIKIGRVPFDNSYRHTMTFGSVAEQTSYFSSVCNASLSGDEYTYVRMNANIRVPSNAENLYTYNYVMYQNANYGTKWFYAFIVGVVFINSKTTELVLELDVMQTWYFDYTLKECFVEREHVNDDTIGAHINPEPEMPLVTEVQSRWTGEDFEDRYVVVQTNAQPHYSGSTVPDGSTSVIGGKYHQVFSGGKYYGFDANDLSSHDSWLFQFLDGMNRAGAADSITSMFMLPKKFAPEIGADHGFAENSGAVLRDYAVGRPSTQGGGYVPHNNKLFTYPYCFCRMTDNNGGVVELRYELWTDVNGFHWAETASIDPQSTCYVIPKGYNGVDMNYDQALVFPVTATCSWVYSAYETWLAQNQMANAISYLSNVAMIAIPAARGIGAAAKVLGIGARKGLVAGTSGLTSGQVAGVAADAGRAAATGIGGLSMGMGAMGLANLVSEYSRQSKIPDVQRGQASGNNMASHNRQTYNVDTVVLREEFARIVDGFFDMYGYQVDSVKVPNRTGRPNWNYVKCQNSCHTGNVPADMMAQINSIYDAGITFWHTSDVGNYSLNNK